jgi:uncharacterized protein (DUF2236 family)
MWIHCGSTEMALRGHERYVETLTRAQAGLFVTEQVQSAALIGLPRASIPCNRSEVHAAIAGVDLRLTKPAAEFARLLLGATMPVSMWGLWALHVMGAIALLPPKAKDLYAFPRWSVRGRLAQAAIGQLARSIDRRFGALALLYE